MDEQMLLGCHVEMVLPGKPLESLEEEHKKYISSVEDFNGQRLVLSMPMLRGKFAPLHKEERYDVYIFVKAKIFQCSVIIEGAIKSENKIFLVTTVTSDFKKYERREFFRLPYTVDVFYRKIDSGLVEVYRQYLKDGREMLQEGFQHGEGIDLSAGGVKFLSGERLHKRDTVIIRLTLEKENGDKEVFVIMSHIIESVNHPNKSGVFINRASFEIQNKKIRESLVSFVFQEQRKALRKSD